MGITCDWQYPVGGVVRNHSTTPEQEFFTEKNSRVNRDFPVVEWDKVAYRTDRKTRSEVVQVLGAVP